MQVFKVNDLKFKESLTRKILNDLSEYFDDYMKNEISSSLDSNIYFAVQDNYGFEGFISLKEKEASLEIDAIGVLKSAQRMKCGQALIKAAIDFAKINKKRIITINIKDDSSKDINYLKTRRFFTKMGFNNLTVVNTDNFINPLLVMAYII